MTPAFPSCRGRLEVICGPMFSGKTEELIRRLTLADIAHKRVQVFKPARDTRFSTSEIVSHSEARMNSESVGDADEILQQVHDSSQVIGIDEANMFGPPLVEVANQLAARGKQVIVAGLDTDFLGRPFPPIPDLLATAELITKMLAICASCGAPANYSQRLTGSEELIVVGAAGVYEARCRHCFVIGHSRENPSGNIRNA